MIDRCIHKYIIVYKSIQLGFQGYARVYRGKQGYAGVRESTHGLKDSVQGYTEVYS